VIHYDNAEQAGHTTPPLAQDVLEYEKTARQAASAGQLLTAIEVARDGLSRFGPDLVLQQQLALALAQTGALDGAREVLHELLKQKTSDQETLSLLGRVHKELWRRTNDPAAGTAALREASKAYGDAFAINESYYPGINLAFTLAALGEYEAARKTAHKVERLCRTEIHQTADNPDGWVVATLAEALTHQSSTAEAAKYYRQAAEIFHGRWRDLASMRRQAREIVGFYAKQSEGSRHHWYDLASVRQRVREALGRSEQGMDWIDKCFDFPSVVVFAGHMIDRPGRTPPRFPAEREPAVKEQILSYLKTIKPGFGYSSAACGADIIFCECLMELGAQVNLVLPCPVSAFKKQSVSFGGPEWERRFHTVIGLAANTLIANPVDFAAFEHDAAAPMGIRYSNRIVTGLAVLQAQALDFELHALAVWDGGTSDLDGGTGSVVGEWEQRQLKPYIISPSGATVAAPAQPRASADPIPVTVGPAGITHHIQAMMFADVINYERIGERQMPAYVQEFKGAIARLLAEIPRPPVVMESWGKSQYFVFDTLQDAANFALALRDLIGRTPWGERGLPAELGVRMVLHAGPVYTFPDPVLKRQTCIGSHVSRAARIEPITPSGQVYATQEFAALCSAEDLSAVSFEFLGRLRTGRLFEDAPLYRLDRRHAKAD
jgi:tetratricopeptide (TPR) repeat protein/class 3 adenylate cyclase